MIPQNIFSEMLPRAAAWAQRQEQIMLGHPQTQSLNADGQEIARRAGVAHPEAVRILGVPAIPLPEETDLRAAAVNFGLITPGTAGLTIGHGIFVRQDCLNDPRLIAHELKHVAQYERHGSIPAFLQQYLAEVNQYGYPANPMEQEAVAFAESAFPSQSHGQQ
jgi:hypothetical protein